MKTREKRIRNEWWDEECKEAISKKNTARNKCLQTRTTANQEQYTQARKEANKTCKEKKKQWLNNMLKQIEEAHKQNETKFFKDIRTFQNDSSPPIFTCKDGNGTLNLDKQEVLDRWKKYFADLMKMDKMIAEQTQEESFKEIEIEIEQPTYKEVSDIIIKLKENKAPGTDNIPAELIKCGDIY